MDSFFLGAKPAQTGGKQTLFSTFFKTELLWIKNVQYQNAQDGKSTIVKTTVYHIICKAALVWKKRISRKIAEYIGIHGCSWGVMCVHGCSLVFMCFCLVVWLFVCLIVWLFSNPHQFFDFEKLGLIWRSLSDCSALDGMGNKPQAGEPQEKRILWNLCERWAAIIFINKNHRLDGVLPEKKVVVGKNIFDQMLCKDWL